MGANQNSSRELGLYPEIEPTPSLLTRQKPHSYRKVITLGTRLDNLKTQQKTTHDASKEHVRD
jgi:hypothetical protein